MQVAKAQKPKIHSVRVSACTAKSKNMGEIWAVLIHSLKDTKSNLALADSNGKVLNSFAGRKPGPQRCNFFVQKITETGEELQVPVTNVTIAIQWYHGLLHMDGKNLPCTISQKTHLTLEPDFYSTHVSPQGSKRAEILLRT